MNLLKIVMVLTLSFIFQSNFAQTSVYVCSTTGAYGYCYGSNEVANCAKTRCENYGGKTCYSIMTVEPKGYGAIALGRNAKGDQVVGASAGYDSPQAAAERALKECALRGSNNCSIESRFLDE